MCIKTNLRSPFTLVRMSTIWKKITENGGDEREILYKFTHLIGVQLHTDKVKISPEDKKRKKRNPLPCILIILFMDVLKRLYSLL